MKSNLPSCGNPASAATFYSSQLERPLLSQDSRYATSHPCDGTATVTAVEFTRGSTVKRQQPRPQQSAGACLAGRKDKDVALGPPGSPKVLLCFKNKLALRGLLNPCVSSPSARTPTSLSLGIRRERGVGNRRLTSASAPAGPAIVLKASSSRRDLQRGGVGTYPHPQGTR